jgi:hypothetical protein
MDVTNLNVLDTNTTSATIEATTSQQDFLKEISQPSPLSADTVIEAPVINADGQALPPPVAPLPEPEAIETETNTVIDAKTAIDGTNRFLLLRKMVISIIFAALLQDLNKRKMFETTKEEDETLREVYKDFGEVFGGMPKYLNIILAEAIIMIPKIAMLKTLKNQSKAIENETPAQIANNTNYDRKYFQIDDNGFYEFGATNRTRIKLADRKERGNVEVHYKQLVEANGEQKIKEIFGV